MTPVPDPDNTPKDDAKPKSKRSSAKRSSAKRSSAKKVSSAKIDAAPDPRSPKKMEPEKPKTPDATIPPSSESSDANEPATGFASGFESLLKNPRSIIVRINEEPGYRIAIKLAITAFVCLLGFGFVVGTMSGGHQLWAAPVKIALGVFISALICLPSLYIFACLTGLNLRPAALVGLLAAIVCLAALLLVGFAPVAWLFAQSTDSTTFYGLLCLAFWGIALYFGFGIIRQTADLFGVKNRQHLFVWAAIFTLVTLQMSTSLRPIIGTAPTFLPTEKKSFLEHWFGQATWRVSKNVSKSPKASKGDGWD